MNLVKNVNRLKMDALDSKDPQEYQECQVILDSLVKEDSQGQKDPRDHLDLMAIQEWPDNRAHQDSLEHSARVHCEERLK